MASSENSNMDHFFQYLRRALHAFVWSYLFFYIFIQNIAWIGNPQKFLVLYFSFLFLGTLGQIILGYIFQERSPKTYFFHTLRMTKYYVVIGLFLYFAGFLAPYLGL
ncbi:MAG: hypothetical protein CMF45_03635 [Legionellales bacterium]|nr:hypothetical protein [Legionellales bacterium]